LDLALGNHRMDSSGRKDEASALLELESELRALRDTLVRISQILRDVHFQHEGARELAHFAAAEVLNKLMSLR